MISDEHMNVIVSDGIAFIRSITTAYGSEEGMKLWETIADTIDPDIKGKIFFSMLTGGHEDRITLSGSSSGSNKIACIKLIREYTGLGLLEAKIAFESAANYSQSIPLRVEPKRRRQMIDALRAEGMIVS